MTKEEFTDQIMRAIAGISYNHNLYFNHNLYCGPLSQFKSEKAFKKMAKYTRFIRCFIAKHYPDFDDCYPTTRPFSVRD